MFHKSIQYALEKQGKSKSGFERTVVSKFKRKRRVGSGNELVDYSRAQCLGADQKACGLWERDCETNWRVRKSRVRPKQHQHNSGGEGRVWMCCTSKWNSGSSEIPLSLIGGFMLTSLFTFLLIYIWLCSQKFHFDLHVKKLYRYFWNIKTHHQWRKILQTDIENQCWLGIWKWGILKGGHKVTTDTTLWLWNKVKKIRNTILCHQNLYLNRNIHALIISLNCNFEIACKCEVGVLNQKRIIVETNSANS